MLAIVVSEVEAHVSHVGALPVQMVRLYHKQVNKQTNKQKPSISLSGHSPDQTENS